MPEDYSSELSCTFPQAHSGYRYVGTDMDSYMCAQACMESHHWWTCSRWMFRFRINHTKSDQWIPWMQRLERLPAHLWALVLQNLSTRALLQARLVCKHFIKLDRSVRLDIKVQANKAKAKTASSTSLILFASRHCAAEDPPNIHLTIDSDASGSSHVDLLPGIMLASWCSNLQSFSCMHQRLELSMAQDCLRLLPSSLKSMSIQTQTSLVDEAAWGRLRALTRLFITWRDTRAPSLPQTYAGSGLMSLTSLCQLAIFSPHSADKLDASNFQMRSLRQLEIFRNPFAGTLDISCHPQLNTIDCYGDTLPAWLEGQAFPTLGLSCNKQLEGLRFQKLMCRTLLIRGRPDLPDHDTDNPAVPRWAMSSLLEMPRLQALVVKNWGPAREGSAICMQLTGSKAEYCALMNLQIDLAVSLELCISSPPSCMCNVKLQRNGHSVACLCASCQRTALE